KLKFLNQEDSLPQAFRAGLAYQIIHGLTLTGEVRLPKDSDVSYHGGAKYDYYDREEDATFSVRAGYRSDARKEGSGFGGLTAGAGLTIYNQTIEYAWVPFGDMGSVHYFSLIFRFGSQERDNKIMSNDDDYSTHSEIEDLMRPREKELFDSN